MMYKKKKESAWLTILLAEMDFDQSPAAQSVWYQDLAEKYDRLCAQLCGKLDDRRAELLRQVLECRGIMEREHNLHYLRQGLIRGAELADRIEIDKNPLIFS